MPLPRLIHPVDTVIQLLDRGNMVMDQDAREPVRSARSTTTIEIKAQVNWDQENEPEAGVGGVIMRSRGYILCRAIDMDGKLGAGIRFKRGDRITQLGHMTGLDLYIQGSEPIGHYPSQNGAALFKFKFSDRKPVQQRGDL